MAIKLLQNTIDFSAIFFQAFSVILKNNKKIQIISDLQASHRTKDNDHLGFKDHGQFS